MFYQQRRFPPPPNDASLPYSRFHQGSLNHPTENLVATTPRAVSIPESGSRLHRDTPLAKALAADAAQFKSISNLEGRA